MLTIVTALPWEAARFRSRLRARRRVVLGDGAFALRGTRGTVEARLLVTGAGEERAERAAEALATLEPAASGVLSAGVAGALDPTLRPGALVLATRVQHRRARGGRRGAALPVDPEFRAWLALALRERGLEPHEGELLSRDQPLASAAEKGHAAEESRARAVQMEDYIWAQWSAARGLPFASLRSVLDPATASLPRQALAWDPAGPSPGTLARALARRPQLIWSLVRLGRQRRAATQALDGALEAIVAAGAALAGGIEAAPGARAAATPEESAGPA